jgi:protoheme IX farnesyltransferase
MGGDHVSILVLAIRRRAAWLARAADYVELTKPGISIMILVTVAVAGFLAAGGRPDLWILLHCLLGTLLVSSSASALNQWMERETDSRMSRTSDRPLPAGRLSNQQVLGFAVLTIVGGLVYLQLAVGTVTMLLALLTWFLYAWIYTPLKSRTPLNTTIGAVSGALPILIGWSATSPVLNLAADPRSAALFLVLFFWQFPHFMAIAWIYRRQYADAGLRMLTVVDPTGRRAGIQAVSAALILLPISLLPAVFAPGTGSVWYVLLAGLLGVAQLACAVSFCVTRDEATARRLLRASLIYLPSLLGCLLFLPLV